MSADSAAISTDRRASDESRRFALRLAFGVAISFGFAEASGWIVTFLAPMLAAQFLTKLNAPPTLRQAAGFAAIVIICGSGMAWLSAALIAAPVVLILALALVLFLSFYAQGRGAPEMLTLMLQISAVTVPVFTIISPAAGVAFAELFAKSAVAALLIVWAAFAVFPAPARPIAEPPDRPDGDRLDPVAAISFATRNLLLLFPILLWYLNDASQIAVVMLITIVMMVRQIDSGTHGRMAIGLLLANLFGGIVAVVAYNFIAAADQFAIFLIVLLAISLGFAGEIARGGTRAPLLALAFGTFILLLGIGLTPLPGGNASVFVGRIGYIVMAAAYTIGANSLLDLWFRPARAAR